MASWSTYVQVLVHIALLFFMVPVTIKHYTETESQFEDYLKAFNKTYNDPDEYQHRLEAFTNSLRIIDGLNLNKTNSSARYGLTKFSDMSIEEFTKNRLVNTSRSQYSKNLQHKRSTHPQKVDWRQKNVISKVRNQHNCGACWAYSAVETIEAMNAIQNNKLRELSVQEIINCAGYNNDGCNGGDVCNLLAWMKDLNFTIHYDSQYDTKWGCKMNSEGVQVEDYLCDNFVGSEQVIINILADIGPVAVAINAQSWQNYIGGVIQYHCDGSLSDLNHAVQVVGYDLSATIPHYIVKNSWGEDFGHGGYLYIAIGGNMCGIANEVSALKVL